MSLNQVKFTRALLTSLLCIGLLSGCAQESKAPIEVTLDETLAESACKTFFDMPDTWQWETLDESGLENLEQQIIFVRDQLQSASAINNAVTPQGSYQEAARLIGRLYEEFLEGKNSKNDFRFVGTAILEKDLRTFCAEL